MMTELFEGKFSPITSEIGFLECDAKKAAEFYCDWQNDIHGARGVKCVVTPLSCQSQEEAFSKLLPLTSVERRRMLFMGTNSQWVAFFDNGWRGTDAFSAISYLSERLKCRGVRALYVPHSLSRESGNEKGRYGATLLERYSPSHVEALNVERSVAVVFDGRRWVFSQSGRQLDFESPSEYENRVVKERFTKDMLAKYLKCLNISAFEERFYNPLDSYLVEKIGASAKGLVEYSLLDVQSNF